MKRSILLAALLLSVIPAGAAPKGYGTITTRYGKSYYECQYMHLYPDGVTFAHRDGAVKIPFAELPESLRSQFHYDPKAEAEYQKQQAVLRIAAQERQKLREIATQEANLAQASRLAATSSAVASLPMPSRGGGPISSRPVVSLSSSRSRGSYSRLGYSGSSYYSGGYSSGINIIRPYCGYSYGGHTSYGGYSGHVYHPTVSGQCNPGHGVLISIGGGG